MRVLYPAYGVGVGHANLLETAIMARLHPESVDLTQLPPKPEKLLMPQLGIADGDAFVRESDGDFSVHHDPRDATPELGEKLLEYAVQQCIAQLT